jgi:hypothetical protein
MSKLFYIQDCRQIVGNCAMWWAKNDAGYTCDLDEAGVYTEDEARRRTSDPCRLDVMRPKDVIDAHILRHFRADRDWTQIGLEPMKKRSGR